MKSFIPFLLFLTAFISAFSQTPDTTATKTAQISTQQDTSLIYTTVEVMPKFPGGEGELMKFLFRNIQCATAEDCVGRVTVRFVINTEGMVEDAVLMHSFSPAMGAEVLRVVRLLPRFEPGKQNGKSVKVYYSLPVIIN